MDSNKVPLDDKFLDALLESGLERLRIVEDRAGLEDRILMRISARKPTLWGFGWSLPLGAALAALALILVAFYLAHSGSSAKHTTVTSAATPGIIAPRQSVRIPAMRTHSVPQETAQARPPLRHASPIISASAPRLAVFPSPTPPSKQERILLDAMKHDPSGVFLLLAENRQPTEQPGPAPLVIEPIEIKPLERPANSPQAGRTGGTSNEDADQTNGRK